MSTQGISKVVLLALSVWFLVSLSSNSSLFAQACCTPSGNSASFGTTQQTNLGINQLKLSLFVEFYDQDRVLANENDLIAPLQPEITTWSYSLLVNYGLTTNLSLSATLPVIARERVFNSGGFGGDFSGSGLGDLRVSARYVFWADSPFKHKALSVIAGSRLPIGVNSVTDRGVTLPQTLQPGTGAYSIFFGPGFFLNFHPVTLFGNGQYEYNFESSSGYQFGDRWEGSIGVSYAFSRALEIFTGTRYLNFAPDNVNGFEQANTGEERIYLFPGITSSPFDVPLTFQAYSNIPVHERVEGLGSGLGFNLIFNVSYTFTFY